VIFDADASSPVATGYHCLEVKQTSRQASKQARRKQARRKQGKAKQSRAKELQTVETHWSFRLWRFVWGASFCIWYQGVTGADVL